MQLAVRAFSRVYTTRNGPKKGQFHRKFPDEHNVAGLATVRRRKAPHFSHPLPESPPETSESPQFNKTSATTAITLQNKHKHVPDRVGRKQRTEQ